MKKTLFIILVIAAIASPLRTQAATNPDIETIRKRIVAELLMPGVSENSVRELVNTLRPDGTWPGIDYVDTARTAFEHTRHLANMVQMSRAYSKKGSPLAGNKALRKALLSALDYWLAHDFICANWWNNEIGTPSDLTAVLLLMDRELSKEQVEKTSAITGRAHINAWGARQSGDRIKIAGIQAKNALFKRDAEQFEMLMKVVEGEIRFVPEDERGLQYDYSFHHRDDRVNNTLSYGLGYADTFAEWADYVAGTRYRFGEEPLNLLVDYYLDGICKMMIYGKYHDPGATNRDISRPRSSWGAGTHTPERLLRVTTWRAGELSEIVKIRRGEASPTLSFDAFYWLTEHYTHQRPKYFASVRMFSPRVRNMEEPYNGEGLTNHHRGDGANYLSQRGDEYFPITPVYDWQKIPGATILQKPALPPETEIQKAGAADFTGAATDGIHGVSAFDFISPHDAVRARKAWFFFDDEYACLGAGITSPSPLPLVTTLNQSKLTGDVIAGQGNYETTFPQGGEYAYSDVAGGWLLHDGTGYIFPESEQVKLSLQKQTGSWFSINRQTNSSREEVGMDVFKLWIEHGTRANNAGYSYIIMPAATKDEVRKAAAAPPVRILSNTSALQAVWHSGLNILQAVFYQSGEITFADGIRLTVDSPALIMVNVEAGKIRRLTVSDATRKLGKIHLHLNQNLSTTAEGVQITRNAPENQIAITLPQGGYAGKSVVVDMTSSGDARETGAAQSRMKIALNLYSFNTPLTEGGETLESVIDYCSDAGFAAIDATGYYFAGYPAAPSDEYINHLKYYAFRRGIQFCGTGVRNDFTLADDAARAKEIQHVKDWIVVAAKLGAPTLRIFAGAGVPQGDTWDATARRVAGAIDECGELARQYGVTLALQNHNDFLKTAEDVEKLFALIRTDAAGLMLDIGSYRTDPYREIEQTIRYAISWQIKENVFVNGREMPADIPRVMELLRRNDYRGYVPIETLGKGRERERISEMLRRIARETP
jgi:chondroitin AC lyase